MSIASKPTPKGWPRISSGLTYADAAKAIDWLCRVFGFEVQLRVDGENGKVVHSQLILGDGLIMLGDDDGAKGRTWRKSPKDIGGANTQTLMVFVDDVEAHHARAKAAGAQIGMEPKTSDYGDEYWVDRTYEAIDLEGHHWWFVQRMKTGGKDA